jgi:Flp pilus assembly protein TadD
MATGSGTLNPQDVVALARQGRFVHAHRLGEQLVARDPRDPKVNHLVGVIACQAGQPRRGAELLGQALAARPGDPEIAFNLAKALSDAGLVTAALELCGRFPGDPRMQRLRAEILKAAGDSDAAIAAWRHQTASHPKDAEAWNNLGNALMSAGQFEEALGAFTAARGLEPKRVPILRNIARILQLVGREGEAIEALVEARELAPKDPDVLLDFGQLLLRLGRAQEAVAVLAEAAKLAPKDPAIFTAIGLAWAALAEFERSEEAYYHALNLDPVNPPALLNLGILLEQSNRTEQLKALIDGAEARGATGVEMTMLHTLALRREGRFDDALKAVRTIEGDAVDASMVALTVAQLADRTGDTALAFAHFETMNQLAANTPVGRNFAGDEHRHFVIGMAKVVTPDWVAAWQPQPPSDLPSPAFLVGFPRSGTTLLDTALMGHSRTQVLEEVPVLRTVSDEAGPLEDIGSIGHERLEHLRLRYFEEVAKVAPAAGGRLVIDKMPLNTLRGPMIARLFPDAPVIFALRHPCDAVLSCFMQNFRINQAMASFLTLENAARFYDAAMDYWMQCRELLPLRVHEVRYEDLVQDREAVLHPLLDFLDLAWEDGVLRHEETAKSRGFIRTPSYAQVTEGIYKRARGRWERYRDRMDGVLDILAPWAIRFGYGDPRQPARE